MSLQNELQPFITGFPAFQAHHLGRLLQDGGSLPPQPIKMDVVEKDEAFEVKADIPGVKKSEIHVHVDGDMLRIAVERKTEKHEEFEAQKEQRTGHAARIHHYERSEQFVGRALRLPHKVDPDSIKASFQDGVLTLDVPKKKAAEEPKRIAME